MEAGAYFPQFLAQYVLDIRVFKSFGQLSMIYRTFRHIRRGEQEAHQYPPASRLPRAISRLSLTCIASVNYYLTTLSSLIPF